MRFSQSFIKTEREVPAGEESEGAKLLTKAGFIDKCAAGIYSFLPLGFRVFKKIENIIRQEFEKEGVEELLMPVVQPADLWKKSKRFFEIGEELWRIKNQKEEEFVLAMTAEEVISEIIKKQVRSYKDLPKILNQIGTKVRNELRSKGGLMRTREFVMQDAYSFDKDKSGLDKSHQKIFSAYKRIFQRLGIEVMPVEADVGAMGGFESWEFMIKNPAGEDTVVLCPKCGYAANLDKAESLVQPPENITVGKQNKSQVHTPKMISAEEVASFLNKSLKEVVKTIIFVSGKKLILALIRGDLKISEKKLKYILQDPNLKLLASEDFGKFDLVSGFVSPVGLEARKDLKVVADFSVKLMKNFIVGANMTDYHFQNVNLEDFQAAKWADLVEVQKGDWCKKCGTKLVFKKAIELGHTFKLGTKYSESMNVNFRDADGKEKPIWMGCFGIGLGRAIAAIAEDKNDDKGLIWPVSVAPYQIYLLNISDLEKAKGLIDKIYSDLVSAGFEVLYDDRDVSVGVKFADCDLIGVPIRCVLSQKTMAQDAAELKMRDSSKTELIKIKDLKKELKKLVK